MPKQRSLTGKQVITILENFGFEIIRVRGSHYQLRRMIEGQSQHLTVPVHAHKSLPNGTLKSIYRRACAYIPASELEKHFFL